MPKTSPLRLTVTRAMLAFGLAIPALACPRPGTDDARRVETPARDGVLVHVSVGPDAPHRALMALSMARTMSKDHDVAMYFDVEAIGLVLADAPDVTHDTFESSHAQIEALLAEKVQLYACPGCLKAAGKTEADLRKGVAIASPEALFDFTSGRILTLDY